MIDKGSHGPKTPLLHSATVVSWATFGVGAGSGSGLLRPTAPDDLAAGIMYDLSRARAQFRCLRGAMHSREDQMNTDLLFGSSQLGLSEVF